MRATPFERASSNDDGTLSVQLAVTAMWLSVRHVIMTGMAGPVFRALLIALCLCCADIRAQQEGQGGTASGASAAEGTAGGAKLSSQQVSSLPLNKRDFSQLLTLAAGTTTDSNGAANFTQQLAINGQRGTTAVFAMDGADTTDPELSGATFTNFNVNAIQEIRSDSGVLPATVGEGAAGFTDIITKSGGDAIHGDVFEFVRNAAFDARNFFDRRNVANPGRLPSFVRNEFGFTAGGPVVLPRLYDGRKRTYFFGQYQGFRQVLGTTQVIPVPTSAERQGIDTTAYSGDTLLVPVNASMAPVLARYPVPNDPQGPYGQRSFATSSKVSTVSNQFSVRVDDRISEKARLFARFNLNNNDGPTTNPSQTAVDPSFALRFRDNQRNAALIYTRTISQNVVSETVLDWIRSTPLFTTVNSTQPGLVFNDGLYEGFNSAAGGNYGPWGNLFQLRQAFTLVRSSHTFKWGFEARFNRDTTIFGLTTNGSYAYGAGTVYSPTIIPSLSGNHDVHPGDPMPDTLSAFLTGTPHSFTASVGGLNFPQGDRIGESAVRREAYNVWFADQWKMTPHLALTYGLRYEANTRFHEGHNLTTGELIVGPDGRPAPFWTSGAQQRILLNPQPPYRFDWAGFGPRVSLQWAPKPNTAVHAGAAVTTLLPNLFQDNCVTGTVPYVLNPFFTALPGAPVPFTNSVVAFTPPPAYTPQGELIFAGTSHSAPANTELDIDRLSRDLAALSPGQPIQAPYLFAQAQNFRNGYIGTYTAGVEHIFGDVTVGLTYMATVGVKLVNLIIPNGYAGAAPAFAPFTRYDANGHVAGGIGPEYMAANPGHSTFHSGTASVTKTSARFGLGFDGNYTFSKSIDSSSSVLGSTLAGNSGTVLQTPAQDPRNTGLEKGPSTFDITHVFAASFIVNLPFDRMRGFRGLGAAATGWQLLNVTTLTSGPPFTVISGIQQTGLGSGGADRPDQTGDPVFSTSRAVREDYFGRGANNTSFFSIPIDVPGGTGPNRGRLGTLGRDTFRGPAFYGFDVALLKETNFGHRGNAEAIRLQFRAEFFNVLNVVNFGLPNNIVQGSGFGEITRTAGTSRQIQFSLRLLY